MVTVKQVIQAGFDFADNDVICVGVGDKVDKLVINLDKEVTSGLYNDRPVKEFAWRDADLSQDMTLSDKIIEVRLPGGLVKIGIANRFYWHKPIMMEWRPSMDNWKSEAVPTETPEEKEALDAIKTVVDAKPLGSIADLATKVSRADAAIRTLEGRGYTWNGGPEWKPPLGEKPKWLETEITYEKVECSIFDMKDDFYNERLFTKKFNEGFHLIKTEEQLGRLLEMNDNPKKNGIYRKVEKSVNWDNKAREFLTEHDTGKNVAWSVGGWKLNMEDMVKFCHLVAEYTPKPN